ncbi:hypothetical protein CH063_09545 [Colletotrichum higginsianum]|uniref:Multicopper oxidase n=1 Tax=Colletotrichum higginsianum (strain IMI 349063) TaxID=759273 RepID=H1VE07_COLHI|nr:Multicopper oxidase [Colletotrichum higginsianum IMI 349063]OBR16089.1 Multicopper oxidase [Colletotrichum higginsianum IMI 349063]CCF38460.1 hypothetical protein CH063_09545 [Colletotrichum higginsianum]
MATLAAFSLFSNLPVELRLNIWEETVSSPSIHVFDVCFPSRRGNDRSERAFGEASSASHQSQSVRWKRYKNSVFLDSLEVTTGDDQLAGPEPRPVQHVQDPSVYRQRRALHLTCREAFSSSALRTNKVNTVYLPGRGRKFEYDNDRDVIFLRFWGSDRPIGARSTSSEQVNSSVSSITEVLEACWSAEMALTVYQALRIAIDVDEMTMRLCIGEVACLASCFQKGLEVLYLVDHQTGDGGSDTRYRHVAADLQNRGGLYRQLHSGILRENLTRVPDLIRGVGRAYREVFDLERLSWGESHPAYIFARLVTDSIRNQQLDAGAAEFKGVRILVVEDEGVYTVC